MFLILSPEHSSLPAKLLLVSYLCKYPHLSPCGNLVPGWISRSKLPFLPVVFLPEAVMLFESTLQLGEFLLLPNLAFPSRLLLVSEKMIVLIVIEEPRIPQTAHWNNGFKYVFNSSPASPSSFDFSRETSILKKNYPCRNALSFQFPSGYFIQVLLLLLPVRQTQAPFALRTTAAN